MKGDYEEFSALKVAEKQSQSEPIFTLPSVKTVEDGHEMGIIRRKQTLDEIEVKYAIEPS